MPKRKASRYRRQMKPRVDFIADAMAKQANNPNPTGATMSKTTKTSTSDIVLARLAAAGAEGVPQASWAKKELAALRRLSKPIGKRPALVARGDDQVWRLTTDGQATSQAAAATADAPKAADRKAKIAAAARGKAAVAKAAEAHVASASRTTERKQARRAPKMGNAERAAQALAERDADAKRGTMKNPVWDAWPALTEKKCGRCGQTKPEADFQISYSSKDGLQHWDRACFNEQAKEAAAKKAAQG